MSTKTTKGSWPRPTINHELAEIGKALAHEKDEDKRATLEAQWLAVRDRQIEEAWEQSKKENPHLWSEE